jgi:hypothetical protein
MVSLIAAVAGFGEKEKSIAVMLSARPVGDASATASASASATIMNVDAI